MDRHGNRTLRLAYLLAFFDQVAYLDERLGGRANMLGQGYDHTFGKPRFLHRQGGCRLLVVGRMYASLEALTLQCFFFSLPRRPASSLTNSSMSLKSRYTDAKRTYAKLSNSS